MLSSEFESAKEFLVMMYILEPGRTPVVPVFNFPAMHGVSIV